MGTRAKNEDGRRRVLIEGVWPEIDHGDIPVKRVVGDELTVAADLVADGHDVLAGVLRYRKVGTRAWSETPLIPDINDRWHAAFELTSLGRWHYTISAWVDHFASWRRATAIKFDAGEDVALELLEGAALISQAARRTRGADAAALEEVATLLSEQRGPYVERVQAALADSLLAVMTRSPDRELATDYDRVLEVVVDPVRARYSTWYELFPRSTGAPGTHGTFADVERHLPYVARMGFDVLYLPPIHPIGTTYRKGRNNSLVCEPDDPGSPWAIGSEAGGHTAIHPELGTPADFRKLIAAAKKLGIDVAMDIAFQCSPDHPWVSAHPNWFRTRPDGSIQYAENPPKKYQDIYPIDFETEDWKNLWAGLRSVFEHWIGEGIRIFRVDNPHTKSLRFWHWCLTELKAEHPDTVFLSEAFTRPKLMYALAKLGFTQSYTYFTWRRSAWELREYLTELTKSPVAEYFRPNFWPNTPDILPEHLVHAGYGAFASRLILAATLTSSYGIYGPAFELMENQPRPGSGEYLDNEKYEIKSWDVQRPDSLGLLIGEINRIRHAHPALQDNRSLEFHDTSNPHLLCYSKRTEDRGDVILVVVTTDHDHQQAGMVYLRLDELGVDPQEPFIVDDLLSDATYTWQGADNYVELNPHAMPAHIFAVRSAAAGGEHST